MRLTASTAAWLLACGTVSIGIPSIGQTQGPPPGVAVAGEIGPRAYPSKLDSLSLGKFEEYRDLRAKSSASPVIEQLLLRYTPLDSFADYSFSARKLLDLDQSMWLLVKRPGQYDFSFRWDRIPHTYSTTARSPGDEMGNPGFNTLPAIRPDSTAWRNAPYIGPIRNQVDPMKASLGLTPNKNLDFKAEWTHIAKNGGIPRSVSFNGSSGPNREYVSPIDQTINDARLSQGYASGDRTATDALSFIRSYQVNAAYAYSRFDNSIKSTMVDNPQLSLSSFTNGAASSRVSLEPSNSAQTASANGAITLPMRTRVMGAVTSTWARQNDPFFPQTSNDSLARDPNYNLVNSYSRPSLDGKTTTSTYTLSATTHPIDKLSLVGRYRSFDHSNQTAPFGIKAMVVSDRTVTLADSENFEAHPYTKINSGLAANYDLARGLAASVGFAWEEWKRDTAVRNIEKTMERTPRASLDYTALGWLTLRANYIHGSRRGNTPYTESATEITGFRRFDEADRDRTRTSFEGSVMPVDWATIGLTLETGDDKFPNSQYGVQSDKSFAKGVDLDLTPTAWFSASAGWIQEDVKDSANYRYRTGAVGSVTYDNPTYRWMNTNKDKNITMFATVNATLVPDKIELIGALSIVDSHWWMFNTNPSTPTGGTAAQNLAATAQDWPEVSQRLLPMSLGLRYRYSRDWAMMFRYQYEKYDQTDFRTSTPAFTTTGLNGAALLPVGFASGGDLPGTIGQVAGSNTGQYHFIADTFHPYAVSWFTILVSFNPALIPFAKARSTF